MKYLLTALSLCVLVSAPVLAQSVETDSEAPKTATTDVSVGAVKDGSIATEKAPLSRRLVYVRPIQVRNDDGSMPANSKREMLEESTRKILSQAAIEVVYLPWKTWDCDTVNQGMFGDEDISVEDYIEKGPIHPDPRVINVIYVKKIHAKRRVGGVSQTPGNVCFIAEWALSDKALKKGGHALHVIAHEMCHALGLGHEDYGAEDRKDNLMNGTEPSFLEDIVPDGKCLSQMTAEQIEKVRSSLRAVVPGFAAPADASGVYVDDLHIFNHLQAQGGLLLKNNKVISGDMLFKQLSEPRTSVDLPVIDGSGQSENAATRATPGVLVVSSLYLCGRCDKAHANPASGVVLTKDGVALTNYHVVKSAKGKLGMVAMTADGTVVAVKKILAFSKEDDLALIQLGQPLRSEGDDKEYKFVPVALGEDPKLADEVTCLSHPSRRFYSVTQGIITRCFMFRSPKQTHAVPRLSISAEFAKGSSGGGIVNQQGQIIGLVSSTKSIYYDESQEKQRNLQMVIRNVIPVERIRALFAPAKETEASTPAPAQ